MGYYTYFTLSYQGPEKDEEALEAFEPKEGEFKLPSDLIKQLIADNGDNDWKWYGWEEDMKKLAKMFPTILFVLHGDGEDSDDLWEWRGKGDEYEFHCFEIPPFTNKNLFLNNE